jgi:Uma2 family endonuclease
MAIRQPKPRPLDYPVSKYHGRRMTEAEFLALPEEKPYLEYVDGVVLQKPMPNKAHSRLVKFIVVAIAAFEARSGGNSGPEQRMRLPDGSGYRLPDTAYWASGRDDGDDTVPTVAIEVRSPGQTMAELRRKCRSFRANGVEVCWLLDPQSRSVEVFEGERDGDRLVADAVLESPAMPGFTLTLSELFAVLDR